MRPMLDPERDLVGATPETLARALFRPLPGRRSGTAREPVGRDEVAVEKVAADESGDNVPHLVQRA